MIRYADIDEASQLYWWSLLLQQLRSEKRKWCPNNDERPKIGGKALPFNIHGDAQAGDLEVGSGQVHVLEIQLAVAVCTLGGHVVSNMSLLLLDLVRNLSCS